VSPEASWAAAPEFMSRVGSSEMVTREFSLPAWVGGSFAELVAEFVSWVPLPMDLRADGTFVVTVVLEAGRCWGYRFLIDGERWVNDVDAGEYANGSDGGCMSVLRT
jgi:hypothetical protein